MMLLLVVVEQDISQNPQVVVLKYNLDTHIQKATALMNKVRSRECGI